MDQDYPATRKLTLPKVYVTGLELNVCELVMKNFFAAAALLMRRMVVFPN